MRSWLVYLVSAVLLVSCAIVPITGRRSLNLIPVETINSMSFQQYNEFLQSNTLSSNQGQVKMIQRVGGNIRNAVESYFQANNMGSQLANYSWEFNLIEDDNINAWCMPGGKVVFYSGILPLMKNEDQVAVVMGHEIAHAVAGHGNERMSQNLLAQMGGMALAKALEEKPQETQALWMGAFGLGAQFGVLLPFSRMHEYEADRLGLIFMTMAGYNPYEAIEFWERMSALNQGQHPPEFASTHPSDQKRIAEIIRIMPEVLTYKPE